MVYLENEYLKIGVASLGAELSSIINKENDKEMLWQADPKFWARHAPVLFPFVGSVINKEYRYRGKTYTMTSHGFARDMEFELLDKKEDRVSYLLRSNEETKKIYPFDFELIISHVLLKKSVKVIWEVKNPSKTDPLYYSIGGHPAFTCPINGEESRNGYKIKFDRDKLSYLLILPETREIDYENPRELKLDKGYLEIKEGLFDEDALVFDDNQIETISLCTPQGEAYVTLNCKGFKSFGLWSKPSSKASYICLEPWLGRCDNKGFTGELPDKYGINMAEADSSNIHEYEIIIH
ncbi:MAG: aldose 1-epimerase family protein [Lachnospiraceae bacterium]|nr:aldose 1-epimerase family protein [Lachnospiraceae bacterium]